MTEESVETPIEENDPEALKPRRVCSTLIDMVCAFLVTVVVLDICYYVMGVVSMVIDAETWVPHYSLGYGFDRFRDFLRHPGGRFGLESIILSTTPIYLSLILLSPLSIGRRIMDLTVKNQDQTTCSILLLMARESVKFLWILPFFWVPGGLRVPSLGSTINDIAASLVNAWVVSIFPSVFLLSWVFGKSDWSIQDIACKTQVHTDRPVVSPIKAGLLGCSFLLFGLYLIFVLIVVSLLSGPPVDFDRKEWEPPYVYQSSPRYALTIYYYIGAASLWTLIVYQMVRMRYILTRGGTREGSGSEEGGSDGGQC